MKSEKQILEQLDKMIQHKNVLENKLQRTIPGNKKDFNKAFDLFQYQEDMITLIQWVLRDDN